MVQTLAPQKSSRLKHNLPLRNRRLGEFCRRWRVVELAFFGSVLREDFRPDSDVDVLVTFLPGSAWSLFDLVNMQSELEEVLDRKVDLVERAAIEQSPNYIRRKSILESAQVVYAAR